MIKIENDCVGCGMPCLGVSCPNRKVPHLYCDKCKEEVDELYKYDDEQLCEECLLKSFDTITHDEFDDMEV